MNGFVHFVHHNGRTEVFRGDQLSRIAKLLIEVLMLAVFTVCPFAGMGLPDVDREEFDIPIPVLLSKPLQRSNLLPKGRSGEGTELQDYVLLSAIVTQGDILARDCL